MESGVQRAGRGFWAACDTALGTGEEFQLGYDRIQAQLAADRQNAQSLAATGQQATGLRAATLAEALPAYRALGWPVVTDGSTAELETGTVAGCPGGAPARPDCWPLAGGRAPVAPRTRSGACPRCPTHGRLSTVIICGEQSFFLAAAGSFPWAGQDLTELAQDAGRARRRVAFQRRPHPGSSRALGRMGSRRPGRSCRRARYNWPPR